MSRSRHRGRERVLAALCVLLGCVASACSDPPIANDAGDSGDDAEVDARQRDATIPPGCEGLEIASDGVLDLDLARVHVQGTITLAGSALPDEGRDRGKVVLVHRVSGATIAIALGDRGPRTYAAPVPPGTYDVVYESVACDPDGRMPCSSGWLSTADLTQDGVLDIDIPVVTITGQVMLDGAVLPDAPADRGRIVLTRDDDTAMAPTLGDVGPGSYQIRVLPGTYDVRFAANPELCAGDRSDIPCLGGIVRSAVALIRNGVLDVDLHAVTVDGVVTLEGGAMVDESAARGALRFTGDGDSIDVDLGTSGTARYAVTLLAGSYDVHYVANPALCTASRLSALPCTGARLRNELELSASGVLDFDLRAVRISGRVTLEGATLPDERSGRGALVLDADDGSSIAVPFGSNGAVTYQLSVFPGTYRVRLDGNEALCAAASLPRVPCVDGVLLPATNLIEDGVLDVDVPVVRVEGRVTVNGAAMSDEALDRGHLTFVGDHGAVDTRSFGTSGDASYAMVLLPGRYDVRFSGNPLACSEPGRPFVPCNGGVLVEDREIGSDGVLDVDVPAVSIEGLVTLGGQALPDAALSRGSIEFRRFDGDSFESESFGASGSAGYRVRILTGRYLLVHAANPALCAPGENVPCASQLVAGCAR